eukprot:TRINITY_DN2770_c0_g1_i1.p2 TRINITY_DN2770_c0_g1~~TRINITY_DN2770_c0_g1_i1.p2  ORF type:complete len:163 (-),score=38.75 TRINITY_DN2770_c0_g1_i1:155-643(-)
MIGCTPYQGDTPEELFNNIMSNNRCVEMDIGYGDDQISPEAADLVDKLLVQDPGKRLGSKGVEEIKSHPFFQGMDWSCLRQQEPPFVPKPANIADTSYFDEKKAFNLNLGKGSVRFRSNIIEREKQGVLHNGRLQLPNAEHRKPSAKEQRRCYARPRTIEPA